MAVSHDSFWLLVGTSAPIIALANVVTLERKLKLSGWPQRGVLTGTARMFDGLAFWAALISFFLSLVTLMASLTALGEEKELIDIHSAVLATAGSLFLIAVVIGCNTYPGGLSSNDDGDIEATDNDDTEVTDNEGIEHAVFDVGLKNPLSMRTGNDDIEVTDNDGIEATDRPA